MRRLLGRYVKHNSLFLFYLLWAGLCGSGALPGIIAVRHTTDCNLRGFAGCACVRMQL
jgi:hypothetical protein